MKKYKLAFISLLVGLVLSLPAVAALAACDPTITFEGKTCVLVGENCGGGVCVCAYNCGPMVSQDDH
jgi:hypothetical protein